MYLEIEGRVRIKIENYKNGVYALGRSGGTGKTYLSLILDNHSKLGEPYKVITYGGDLSNLGKYKNCKVVMFDRLDLYYTDEVGSIIEELSKNTTVLVDLKMLHRYKGELGLTLFDLHEDEIQIVLL